MNLRLSDEEIANFALQRPHFPGVDFQPRLIRYYPHGEAIAHAVGYVGALSKSDLQRLEQSEYAGTAHTGKTGVENRYESDLHGDVGYNNVVTNALGREVPTDSREVVEALPDNVSAAPGNDVYLSLDLDLQRHRLGDVRLDLRQRIDDDLAIGDLQRLLGEAALGLIDVFLQLWCQETFIILLFTRISSSPDKRSVVSFC